MAMPYPYELLLSLVTFMFLSLFSFIRDSVALMDDSLIVSCEPITNSPILSPETLDAPDKPPPKSLPCSDTFLIAFLYILILVDSVAMGLFLASMQFDKFQLEAAMHFCVRAFEFFVLAWFSSGLFRAPTHWTFGAIAILGSSVAVAIPLHDNGHGRRLQTVSGFTSGALMGAYIFLGSVAIHQGLTEAPTGPLATGTVMFLSFAVPTMIQIARA
jgi:hypothetical protein